MNVTHWDGPWRREAMDFFNNLVDIPMSIWYLTFYSDPTTKYIVIAKILVDSLESIGISYGRFIETYLYYEKDIEDMIPEDNDKTRTNNYDNSNFVIVLAYNAFYILISPFIALMEIWIGFKNAVLQRDLDFFQEPNELTPVKSIAGSPTYWSVTEHAKMLGELIATSLNVVPKKIK